MKTMSIGFALLAVQRSFLREITPQLRAVDVDINKEKKLLFIRCYYDLEVSEKQFDLWDCAISEAHAALAHVCDSLDGEVERLDYPQPIPVRGRLAYLRKETPVTSPSFISAAPIKREIVDFKEKIGAFRSPVDDTLVDTHWGVIHYGSEGCHIVPAKPMGYEFNDINLLAYALLALQTAILGTVTPELRCILVDLFAENSSFYMRFYYDGEVSYGIIDGWERAITEVIADLGAEYSFDAATERLDYPEKIPFRGRCAYFRKE